MLSMDFRTEHFSVKNPVFCKSSVKSKVFHSFHSFIHSYTHLCGQFLWKFGKITGLWYSFISVHSLYTPYLVKNCEYLFLFTVLRIAKTPLYIIFCHFKKSIFRVWIMWITFFQNIIDNLLFYVFTPSWQRILSKKRDFVR